MCLWINENSVYYSLYLAGGAKRRAAKMASQQWEKLSPSEFQQLQELASCKYRGRYRETERERHTEHPSATLKLPKQPSIQPASQPHKHKTRKYVAEESFCLAYYGRRKYLLNVKRNSVQYLIFARFILAQRWPCLLRGAEGARDEWSGEEQGKVVEVIWCVVKKEGMAIDCCVGEVWGVKEHTNCFWIADFLFDPGDASFSITIKTNINTYDNKLRGHTGNHYKRPEKLQIDCWMFYWFFPLLKYSSTCYGVKEKLPYTLGSPMQPNRFHRLARLINKYSSVPFHSHSRAGGMLRRFFFCANNFRYPYKAGIAWRFLPVVPCKWVDRNGMVEWAAVEDFHISIPKLTCVPSNFSFQIRVASSKRSLMSSWANRIPRTNYIQMG